MLPGGDHRFSATIDHLSPRTIPGTQRPVVAAHRLCNNRRHHDPAVPDATIKEVQACYRRGTRPFGVGWEAACLAAEQEIILKRLAAKRQGPTMAKIQEKRQRRQERKAALVQFLMSKGAASPDLAMSLATIGKTKYQHIMHTV